MEWHPVVQKAITAAFAATAVLSLGLVLVYLTIYRRVDDDWKVRRHSLSLIQIYGHQIAFFAYFILVRLTRWLGYEDAYHALVDSWMILLIMVPAITGPLTQMYVMTVESQGTRYVGAWLAAAVAVGFLATLLHY